MKDVMIVTGAGQISMAIARRIGYGKKIIMGDKRIENAKTIAEVMNNAGFDVVPFEMDLSSRESIFNMIDEAKNMDLLQCWSMVLGFRQVRHLLKLFSMLIYMEQQFYWRKLEK